MPKQISQIPGDTQIVVPQRGSINTFFRLRWEEVRNALGFTPDVASLGPPDPLYTSAHAAIVTTTAYTVLSGGLFRLNYYMRKIVADGVSSSLTMTLGWTDHGLPVTEAEAALTTDTTAAQQSLSKLVYADAASAITFAVAYASNTPGLMKYNVSVVVEQMA